MISNVIYTILDYSIDDSRNGYDDYIDPAIWPEFTSYVKMDNFPDDDWNIDDVLDKCFIDGLNDFITKTYDFLISKVESEYKDKIDFEYFYLENIKTYYE